MRLSSLFLPHQQKGPATAYGSCKLRLMWSCGSQQDPVGLEPRAFPPPHSQGFFGGREGRVCSVARAGQILLLGLQVSTTLPSINTDFSCFQRLPKSP
jgi:hypothetical protein